MYGAMLILANVLLWTLLFRGRKQRPGRLLWFKLCAAPGTVAPFMTRVVSHMLGVAGLPSLVFSLVHLASSLGVIFI